MSISELTFADGLMVANITIALYCIGIIAVRYAALGEVINNVLKVALLAFFAGDVIVLSTKVGLFISPAMPLLAVGVLQVIGFAAIAYVVVHKIRYRHASFMAA